MGVVELSGQLVFEWVIASFAKLAADLVMQ